MSPPKTPSEPFHAADSDRRSSFASRLEPFCDGFTPGSCGGKPTRLLRNPKAANLGEALTVLPDVVTERTARDAYNFTVSRPIEERSWGTYLRLLGEDADGELQVELRGAEPEVEAVAAALLREFWRSTSKLLRPDLKHVHGWSIWAVAGGVGAETAYHVDYAEIFRRKTNILVPPVHAATLQISPVGDGEVEGGTFGAHSGGLAHYSANGHKCCKSRPRCAAIDLSAEGGDASGAAAGGAAREQKQHDKPTPDWMEDPGWTYVPYKFRQGTLSMGELPHASDVVRRWPEGLSRVVVGINSMGFIEGPSELRCPQHSLEFRTNLKLEMLIRKAGGAEAAAKMLATQLRKKRGKAQSAASDQCTPPNDANTCDLTGNEQMEGGGDSGRKDAPTTASKGEVDKVPRA